MAMAPMPCTIFSILSLVNMPYLCLESSACVCGTMPCDEYCYGCGPVSMASCACAFPPCLGYMNHLFGTRVQKYLEKLTTKTKPKKILVCMIYYLDETPTPSWAGRALRCLGYDSNPQKLQCLIRRMFVDATSKIRISGTEVIPVPLFNALDGKTSEDYIARVEPSSQGGKKMAEYLLDIIEQQQKFPQQENNNNNNAHNKSSLLSSSASASASAGLPVEASYIVDRS